LALDDVLVIASAGADIPQRSALTLFVDEAQRRTGRRWPVRFGAPNRDSTRLRLIAAREDQLPELLPAVLSTRLDGCEALRRDEGYSIRSVTDRNRLWIVVSGHDDRGMLYGLGYLLRHTDWSGGRAKLDVPAACVAPALAVRGPERDDLGFHAGVRRAAARDFLPHGFAATTLAWRGRLRAPVARPDWKAADSHSLELADTAVS